LSRSYPLFTPHLGRRTGLSRRPTRRGRAYLEPAVPARSVRVSHRAGHAFLQRAHVGGELSQPLSIQRRRGSRSGLEWQGAVGSAPSGSPSPRDPATQRKRVAQLHGPGCRRHRPARQGRGGGRPLSLGSVCASTEGRRRQDVPDYLAEVTPSGQTVWEWRTWEHLDPVDDGITEIQAPRTLWAQGNSVLELPDGDILTSYRPTSTVLRISPKTGKILWKLGAPTVAGQHAPTPLDNGNILIFDNGAHRLDDSMPFSRAIEVNPATNEIVWKYQDRPAWNFFSPRMGNAQRLPNG